MRNERVFSASVWQEGEWWIAQAVGTLRSVLRQAGLDSDEFGRL